MIPQVQTVADTIASERARFERFCRSLNEEALARPVPQSTWIVKDFISHLATIDAPITRWFERVAGGDVGRAGPDGGAWDVDRFNDAEVAKRRERSVEVLLAEAARERAALLVVMDGLSQEQVSGTIHFGGDSKRPPRDLVFGQYLQGWARHDVIHVADMLKALPERRSDPDVVAWLAEPEVAALVGFYQKAMA
jgi:hypothetical protein